MQQCEEFANRTDEIGVSRISRENQEARRVIWIDFFCILEEIIAMCILFQIPYEPSFFENFEIARDSLMIDFEGLCELINTHRPWWY